MRYSPAVWISILLTISIAAIGFAQSDPLVGRWEGTLMTGRGSTPVVAKFAKEKEKYGGSITGLRGSEVPFTEVKVDKEKVNAKFEMQGPRGNIAVTIKFILKGDSLQGKADVGFGPQPVTLNYALKRSAQLAQDAPDANTPAVNPTEMQEYEKLAEERDHAAKKQLIGSFIQQHPQSTLINYVYQQGAYLGRDSGDMAMMAEFGEKALAGKADNFVLMTDLADAYVRRNQSDKAEPLALRALELIGAAQKPENLTDEQWTRGRNIVLSMNFATLGFVHLRRAQVLTDAAQRKVTAEKSVAPFKKALEYQPKDDYSLYGLGFIYTVLNDYSNAEAALAKSVALSGPISPNAMQLLEDIYKAKNKKLDGLDLVIAKAKSELGIP